jgi:hypothetical protein
LASSQVVRGQRKASAGGENDAAAFRVSGDSLLGEVNSSPLRSLDTMEILMAEESRSQERLQSKDLHPEVFKIFDRYVHGFIDRRDFLESVSKFAVGGITAAAILDAFTPNLNAQQVDPDDKRIKAEYESYPSPKGHGGMKGYLARPAKKI